MIKKAFGFTLVEVLIVIVVISILAAISVVGYNGAQQHAAQASVQSDLDQATSLLNTYRVENHTYPPNLGGTTFVASPNTAIAMYTNAPQTPQYVGLTADQNAQLFLNTCNGQMPIVISGSTYNTSCTFAGNNIHADGQRGSNIVWKGPTIQQSDIVLTCGSACTTAQQTMISLFQSQGGTFPIQVPKNQVALPAQTMVTTGQATKFCLQATSGRFNGVVFHASSDSSAVVSGVCPANPELHYP